MQASQPLLTACDGNSCQYGWIQPITAPGRFAAGPIDGNRDVRSLSFHAIDKEHYIAQIVQTGRNNAVHAQYCLVRFRNGAIRAYSLDLDNLNLRYLEKLEGEGGIVNTASSLAKKAGLNAWEVQNRETLVKVFTDVSALPEAELKRIGRSLEIKSMTQRQLAERVFERARATSKVALDESPVSVNVSATTLAGCPTVLPQAITCRQYANVPTDLHPRLDQEVIYLSKYGCAHCRNIAGYVGAWQTASPEIAFYYSSIIDFKELTASLYKPERVPAFIVNRKYLVEIDTSEKQLVEYALSIVSGLARERQVR